MILEVVLIVFWFRVAQLIYPNSPKPDMQDNQY